MRLTRPASAAPLLAAAALLLSACSSSPYDAVDLEGLGEGPCAPVVDTLEEVDAQLRALAEEDTEPRQVAERFVPVQDDLKQAGVGEVEPALTDLVTALGFFRISVDSSTYDRDDADRVRTSLGALADACRDA